MVYVSKTGKTQPAKARGTRYRNLDESRWHDLAIRLLLRMERRGKVRYAVISRALAMCGVLDRSGKRFAVKTLKRTLARKRKMVAEYRQLFKDARDDELLGFAPDASKAQKEPASVEYAEMLRMRDFLLSQE